MPGMVTLACFQQFMGEKGEHTGKNQTYKGHLIQQIHFWIYSQRKQRKEPPYTPMFYCSQT